MQILINNRTVNISEQIFKSNSHKCLHLTFKKISDDLTDLKMRFHKPVKSEILMLLNYYI